jgi:hypothetical protein
MTWNDSVESRINGEELMKKFYLPVLVFLGAGMTVGIPQALAETAPAKVVKNAPAKVAMAADDDVHPELAGHSRTDFNCELGNKISVYESPSDSNRIGLRWNKKMHELTRVGTTTGANRFENKEIGLVWIKIPSKAMLLDSKKGQQLANECRSAAQMKVKKSNA